MFSKNTNLLLLTSVYIFVLLIGFGRGDFQQDRAECADQLVGLSTCLPYVSNGAKTPTPDCCSAFKQVVQKSRKCLCLLIKYRNDPNLGIKINASLAANLPSLCNAPANVTECIDILHLSPSSPDAKVFAGFANITRGSTAAPISNGNSNGTSSSASPTTDNKNGGGDERERRSLGAYMIYVILIWEIIYFII